MNKIVFTEEFCQPENLHPFTLTRQMQDIRVGILTIREKWEKMLGMKSFDKKEDDYKDLQRSVHIDEAAVDSTCYIIHGNLLPTSKLVKAVLKLKNGEFIATAAGNGIVYKVSQKEIIDRFRIKVGKAIAFDEPTYSIRYPWDIFLLNDWAIRQDFELLTKKKKSMPLPESNRVTKPSQVFICKGASVENAVINASEGPVFIGKNAEIMDGCLIRGPVAIGEGARLKMGSKIYGATTIGPGCIAGGEIKNSVMFGYSNKSHDGYLGDSVIGEWCNLGAGTTNSNLKNNAGEVRIWTHHGEMSAGNKCGVMMADYCTTAVNTAINTGTVIGVCSNVFGNGLTPKYIPNFSWGSEGVKRYELDKLFTDLEAWKKLKGRELTGEERDIIRYIYGKY
jgi:UDP-N-acetylglucosamine diphosphorylase / glucose-1-phosphate thymidylyltransferase / UDP-N-acetylgalactosamine diphosphorylase / glucosamine-1-phosphate N-acetyltransferase / galactosamine-1-phosphate N-acetyltransferase